MAFRGELRLLIYAHHMPMRTPAATARSTIGKFEAALDPVEPLLDVIYLRILVHIGNMNAAQVPLYRSKPQYHLAHVIRQAVNARADVAQVLEHEIGRFLRHGISNPVQLQKPAGSRRGAQRKQRAN